MLRAGLHAFRANVDGAASYCWTDDADRVLALAAKLGRLEWEAPESDNGANCKLGTGPATEPR